MFLIPAFSIKTCFGLTIPPAVSVYSYPKHWETCVPLTLASPHVQKSSSDGDEMSSRFLLWKRGLASDLRRGRVITGRSLTTLTPPNETGCRTSRAAHTHRQDGWTAETSKTHLSCLTWESQLLITLEVTTFDVLLVTGRALQVHARFLPATFQATGCVKNWVKLCRQSP